MIIWRHTEMWQAMWRFMPFVQPYIISTQIGKPVVSDYQGYIGDELGHCIFAIFFTSSRWKLADERSTTYNLISKLGPKDLTKLKMILLDISVYFVILFWIFYIHHLSPTP